MAGIYLRKADDFEDWQLSKANYLQHLSRFAYHEISHYYLQNGNFSESIEWANRMLLFDSLWETAIQILMKSYGALGEKKKALDTYIGYLKRVEDETAISLETRDIYEKIKVANLPLQITTPVPNNLPSELSPFVLRHNEIRHISSVLSHREIRLISLVGLGGVGKSRLALHLAQNHLSNFPDGVYFITLHQLEHQDDILEKMLIEMELTLNNDVSLLESIIQELKNKKILLILDGFENNLEDSSFLLELLKKCHNLKLLITSRQAVGIAAEKLILIDGMNVETDARPSKTRG